MAKKKVYAVKNGRRTGIFDTWEECRRMVIGFPNAVYKSFYTMQEAQQYLSGMPSGAPGSAEKNTETAGGTPAGAFNDPAAEPADGGLTAYVDGSFHPKLRRCSFGCILLTPDGRIIKESGSSSDERSLALRNVAGEMLGAVHAVKWAEKNGYPSVDIRYDYAGIEQWATHGWQAKNELTRQYAAFMDDMRRKIAVTFTKIAAHTGDEYNEAADQLAKEALTKG